jgi:restriction system protein
MGYYLLSQITNSSVFTFTKTQPGTVMNEGATKGILVTTSDYGKDSYEFAKNKPITLLHGSNLLSLLEKHGHKARINIAEAKKIMKV